MRAGRIAIPDTAFRLSHGKKRPRVEDGRHLKAIRQLPCCICGTYQAIEAAHIRMASRAHGKDSPGSGEKPSDRWAIPLCAGHHRLLPDAQHNIGEEAFWSKHRTDPFLLALCLFGAGDNVGVMETIVRETIEARRHLIAAGL